MGAGHARHTGEGSTFSKNRSVHEALVRERDVYSELTDIYEIIAEIGHGGFSNVYKIQKKHDKIGGSSREANVRTPRGVRIRMNSLGSVGLFSRRSNVGKHGNGSVDGQDQSFFSPPDDADEMYFALKVINLAMVKDDKLDQLKNEVEILKALDHHNIVKAYEVREL